MRKTNCNAAGWKSFLIYSILLMLTLVPTVAQASSFIEDCKALTRNNHRLSGTPEYAEAASHIEKRLNEIGVDEILVQEFPVPQTFVQKCVLNVQDTASDSTIEIQLLPCRSNGIIPPVTPKQGLSGKIIYVGGGEIEEFKGCDPRNNIIVLDYNCGNNWLRAFRLGAKAVIFISDGSAKAWHSKSLEANSNIPRFYYNGPVEDLFVGSEAVLHSEVVWKTVTGRNVIGLIRGTSPVFQMERDEIVVLAAHLDSYGEVPCASPGARAAANCAGLLEIAKDYVGKRPKRHIMLLFLDGQGHGHQGSNAFYRALEKDFRLARVDSREKSIQNEKKMVAGLLALVNRDNPLESGPDDFQFLMERIKKKTEYFRIFCRDTLAEMRISHSKLTENDSYRSTLKAQIDEMEKEKKRWNNLMRDFTDNKEVDARDDLVQIVIKAVKKDLEKRDRELKLDEKNVNDDKKIDALIGDGWITLHASMMLGDNSKRWGPVFGGQSQLRSARDLPGLYGKIQKTFYTSYNQLNDHSRAPKSFLLESVEGSIGQNDLLWAAPYCAHSGDIAGMMGVYNIAISTSQENFSREGTPDDKLENLDTDRITAMLGDISALLRSVAGNEELSLRRSIIAQNQYYGPVFNYVAPQGPVAMAATGASAVPNTPMSDATVQIYFSEGDRDYRKRKVIGIEYQKRRFYAFDDYWVLRTNGNGSYNYGPMWEEIETEEGFAVAFDERGEAAYASSAHNLKKSSVRLNMYPCRTGYAVLFPQLMPMDVRVFDAKATNQLRSERTRTFSLDGIVSWFSQKKTKSIKLFGYQYPSLACTHTGDLEIKKGQRKVENPFGTGISAEEGWTPPVSARQSAVDLWRLDESRIQLLRSKNCMNSSLEELHGRAECLLTESQNQKLDPAEDEAFSISAFLIEKTVYSKLKKSIDDLVKAVLILLALTVPFAFAMERLLIGSNLIVKQIVWFVVFFIISFFLLYLTHPAFGVTATPIVIFLGFAVVVMSGFVITVLLRKFEYELKRLQGLSYSVHAADVSRFGTVVAAMNMGISTMRRRPLRTALTAITIVLLTFTILSFASFGAKIGIVKMFMTPSPNYNAVQLRKIDRNEFDPSMLDVVRQRWGGQSVVCPRYWIAPKKKTDAGVLVTRGDGSGATVLQGILGLSGKELLKRKDFQKALNITPDQFEGKAWISEAVANRLNVQEGDSMILCGQHLVAGKILNASDIIRMKDMDNSDILPVKFTELEGSQRLLAGQKKAFGDNANFNASVLALQAQKNWNPLSADVVAIVPENTAKKMGAGLHLVTLYTEDSPASVKIAEEMARMTQFPINATRNDGVYLHVLGPVLEASGFKDLLFPIILGGLVIFGTMLGSVTDREKEIYTFSALGLAPPHVAGLFLAESMVYSVVGGMGGYLLANGVVKVLSIFAQYGMVNVPEMNYSSTNAIVTILIVMATVLVSAIYPAIKASRSANPGVLRSWKLPEPEGDIFNIIFPFTVSGYDISGVVGYLKEHFNNFSDTGLGNFMATNTKLLKKENGQLGIYTELALAPFDLGVTQKFELWSNPSEIPGIDEVTIEIKRVSGQPKDWQRLNKILLDSLRKQFLIWRSLASETMESYRERTFKELEIEKGSNGGE